MAYSQMISTPGGGLGRAVDVPDRGVDAPRDARPGVPMERDPQPLDGSSQRLLIPQRPSARVLKRMEIEQLTPVFGTAQPPKGLSGLLRVAAYATPEHLARHWLLLLFADRVDVLEHRLAGVAKFLPLALPIVAFRMIRARNRRRASWRLSFG